MKFVEPIKDKKKLIEMYETLKNNSIRDALLFRVGLNTMLRIGDILRLKRQDFMIEDDFRDYLTIRTAKTQKTLRIPINDILKKEIKEYVDLLKLDNEDYLFFSLRIPNKHIDRVQAWRILKKASLKCGIKNLGTHTIRKTAAWRVYNDSKDLALVQDMLGHSSPKVTVLYLGINQETIDEAFRKYAF